MTTETEQCVWMIIQGRGKTVYFNITAHKLPNYVEWITYRPPYIKTRRLATPEVMTTLIGISLAHKETKNLKYNLRIKNVIVWDRDNRNYITTNYAIPFEILRGEFHYSLFGLPLWSNRP